MLIRCLCEGKKDRKMDGWKKGRKEERKEGKREGGKEERKERKALKAMGFYPFYLFL